MTNEQELKQLAETLKSSGLATNMMEAMEKARSILLTGTENIVTPAKSAEKPQTQQAPNLDDPTVNIADSNATSDEIISNDKEILDKARQGEQMDENSQMQDSAETSESVFDETERIVMTNDELQEQSEAQTVQPEAAAPEKPDVVEPKVAEQSILTENSETKEQTQNEKAPDEKPTLTEKEKEDSDLSKLFNYGKR